MRQLFLYPITGLYNECHDVDYVALRDAAPPASGDHGALRTVNNLWWRQALEPKAVRATVDMLGDWLRPGSEHPAAWEAIVAAPQKFVDEVVRAPQSMVDLGAGPRAAFRALETLQLYVDIHSATVGHPFELSLQEGYVLNELSSLELIRAALSPSRNPYLPFLREFVFPVIEDSPPDLAWIVGRIKLSTMAMAMKIKEVNPACHVSVVGHSSEYYSLNKITKYLRTNSQLFSVIDSIVLDDFDNTPRLLREALEGDDPLESVPNLMYRQGDLIHQTGYVVSDRAADADLRSAPPRDEYALMIAPSLSVAETRLWPAAQCYWNNCNFCAINRRYNTLPRNSFSMERERAQMMVRLSEQGTSYLWSVDEAIPPVNLGILAKELIALGSPLTWETRSKIDRNFSSEICADLGESGLREIRLGFESASPRVLALMGKYPDGWSLDLVEQIVARFHSAGVSVHFPTIVGFPGETADEREETYEFLASLVAKYPSVTFNVNILGFDVASKLFENYEEFGVTTLRWPTPTKYFLENLIDWDCAETPFNYGSLDAERNEFMRRVLYPWMPASASIPPYIFYRLTETSRATMVWKAQRAATGRWREPVLSVDVTQRIRTSNSLVVMGPFKKSTYASDEHYSCYVWETHQAFECDGPTARLLEILTEPRALAEAAEAAGLAVEEADAVVRSLAAVGAVVAESVDAASKSSPAFVSAPRRWRALPGPAPAPRARISTQRKQELSLTLGRTST
ncbi:radical SAM protein [Streptomyces sp. AK02-01A]|uniref:B12-binding domain-containing radical SAM protein n=1 Tax=Streptomyces sp. AK02-01A TaxID=3028648 RepID=UPI0029BDEF06|nr:radical SAM protein [Streptomyces sp. AK02-01A]MDX3849714.1 radical SAM protein [Streptomyces sp. AK02-01A]MDX3849716.1 radical SAM protein [Streptomyces sp. AK02-01A]